MSVMLSAAGSLRWFRDALAPASSFGDLVAAAADVPAGSDGLCSCPTSPASAARIRTRWRAARSSG